LNDSDYTELRIKIKTYQPYFLDHLENVLRNWLRNRKNAEVQTVTEEAGKIKV